MKQLTVAVFLFVALPAQSGVLVETINDSCDPHSQKMRIQYLGSNEVSNSSSKATDALVSGHTYSRKCTLGPFQFETTLRVYEPTDGGQCGAAPGGNLENLKVNGKELANNVPINNCYTSWIDDIKIAVAQDSFTIIFCGSTQRKRSEQEGCFIDHHRLSEPRIVSYKNGDIPFFRFRSKRVFDGEIKAMDGELLVAVSEGELPSTMKFIQQGADPYAVDGNGRSSLVTAVTYIGDPKLVAILTSRPANSNNMHQELDKALFQAASRGDAELAALLLKAGADPNERSNESHILFASVLNARYGNAFQSSYLDKRPPADFLTTVKLLLKHGANPNSTGQGATGTAIDVARRTGQVDILKALTEAAGLTR